MAVTGHGPDESSLILDSARDTGYFGSFSSFISPSALESAVGIAVENPNYYYDYESNSEYAEEVSNLWMKFYYKGKYLFIPKTPFGWSEWSRIYHRGAVFGNDLAWPDGRGSAFWRNGFSTDFDRSGIESPVVQNRRVSIGAYAYKVRLVGGQENPVWGGWPDALCDEAVGANSEWNELLYRTLIIDPVMLGTYNKYIVSSGSACSPDERFYKAHGGVHPSFSALDFYWDTIPQTVHQVSLAYSTELWPSWPWRGGYPCYTRDVCWAGLDDLEHESETVAPVARGGSIYYGSYEISGVHAHLVAGQGAFGFSIQNQAAWLPCLELDIEQAPDENSIGSVVIPVVQVSGTGQQVSYGIISIPLFNLQGYGINQFTAVGGVVLPKLRVVANTRSFGKVTFPGLSLYGRSYSESFANGTIALGKVGIKGTVILENFGGAHIPMPKLKVGGRAKVLKVMTGSGEIILPATGVSGVTYNGEPFDFTSSDEIVFKYDPSRGLI